MAPAPTPDQTDPDLIHVINNFWLMIAGVLGSIWLFLRTLWNFSSYVRGIDDRFDRLDHEIAELKDMVRGVNPSCPVDRKS